MAHIFKNEKFRILFIFIILIISGIIGYIIIEDLSFFESLYMAIITISTVGFQEVKPLGFWGRIITICLIISGISIIAYIGTHFVDFLARTNIFRRNKMLKKIKGLKDHYIICGFGRMGSKICQDLSGQNVQFVVIDNTEAHLESLESLGYNYIIGNALEENIMLQACIEKARGAAATLPNDPENVFLILTIRELNNECFIIARASEEENEKKLIRAGADRVIYPYKIGAGRMAQILTRPRVVDFLDSIAEGKGINLKMEEIYINKESGLTGRSLKDSDIRNKFGIIVIAIYRKNGEMIYNPDSDIAIDLYDTLVVVGDKGKLENFKEKGGFLFRYEKEKI
ncbi:potassium channel family protein [Spirochaetota bacterium]